MSELEKKKFDIVSQLRSLCAHCACGNRLAHRCPVQEISARIAALSGVPLTVNNEFKGLLLSRI